MSRDDRRAALCQEPASFSTCATYALHLRPSGRLTPIAPGQPRPTTHTQLHPRARNSTQHVLERLRLCVFPPFRVRSPQTLRLCLLHSPFKARPTPRVPAPRRPHRRAAYLHPTLRQPNAAATHAPSAHRARDASVRAVCRGPARRRKRTGALRRGSWWRAARFRRRLAATELTRACTSFVCLRRLSCCTRLRGAPRARPAALRAPARS